MDEVCEGCGEEGGNHAADCFTWEGPLDGWAGSLSVVGASTSYEDYLRGKEQVVETNPWFELHVVDEAASSGWAVARQLVGNEYRGAPLPMPCACGGVLWWRATIGARKCPSCGQLANASGSLIGGPKQ